MVVATVVTVPSAASSCTRRPSLSSLRRPHFPCPSASPSSFANSNHSSLISRRNSTFPRTSCCSNSPTSGFGTDESKVNKKSSTGRRDSRKFHSQRTGTNLTKAPVLNSQNYVLKSTKSVSDIQFEERLQAIRRSALEQKKAEEDKQFGAIDYDTPVETKSRTVGLGTKIGVGAAVVAFGLIFALGDFLPTGSPTNEVTTVDKKISDEKKKASLQKRLEQFEDTLATSPEDPTALEGAAVTLAELGEYSRASSLLENLTKTKPNDPDVFRLLGEVKYELGDYEGSAMAFRSSKAASKSTNFEVLRGLTNALIAAKKPDQAVQMLLASREHLSEEKLSGVNDGSDSSSAISGSQVDPMLVELLLGKAYSDWGHVSDAVAVYDKVISSYPDDFRGYLAKGIILKENGNVGDAERMFIQARFYAPKNAKALVDKYSR